MKHSDVRIVEHSPSLNKGPHVLESLPSLKYLAEKYGYRPVESTQPIERLDIQWDAIQKDALTTAFQGYDSVGPAGEHTEDILYQTSVPLVAKQKALRLEIKKNQSGKITEWPDSCHVALQDVDAEAESIAELGFWRQPIQNGESWSMGHRFVLEKFREQGIMGHLVQLMEQQIAERASQKRITQEIEVEVAQADVLVFLLKRSYEPVKEDDEERIRTFFQGDSRLAIVTPIIDGKPVTSKQWYIVEKDKLFRADGMQDEGVWTEEGRYEKDTYRIKLKKVFTSKEAIVAD